MGEICACSFQSDLDRIALQLKELTRGPITELQASQFYDLLQNSSLPHVATQSESSTNRIFTSSVRTLHEIGRYCPAIGYGLENHLMVVGALACTPFRGLPLDSIRTRVLETIGSSRVLLANSGGQVHGGVLGALGLKAQRLTSGNILLNGSATFASLAHAASWLYLITSLDGEPAILLFQHKTQPGLQIGDYTFGNRMIESDTRKLHFDNCEVEASALLGHGELVAKHLEYNLNWHQTLLAAVFLGSAFQAIQEVRDFLRHTKTGSGQKLSELDGMHVEVARLYRKYHLGLSAVLRVGQLLEQMKHNECTTELLDHTAYAASMAKIYGTLTAESIVRRAFQLVGTRAFIEPNHRLCRLCDEVAFGTVGPLGQALTERELGRDILSDETTLRSTLSFIS